MSRSWRFWVPALSLAVCRARGFRGSHVVEHLLRHDEFPTDELQVADGWLTMGRA